MLKKEIHVFNNGVKVYSEQLLELQKKRYNYYNLHEPEEESIFLEFINSIKVDGTYVSVGSAIGYYPLLAKLNRPNLNIYAYEPLKMHRKYFLKNIKLNGFSKKDFKLYHYGISSSDGLRYFKKNNYGSFIENKHKKHGAIYEYCMLLNGSCIKTITLKTVLDQIKNNINLIQIDIQGHEKEVLYASRDILSGYNIEKIIIGTHKKEIHEHCLSTLELCGYNIVYNNFETKKQPDGILAGVK